MNYILLSDFALPGQMGYQCIGTTNLGNIIELHDKIIFYLIILFVIVLWFFVQSLLHGSSTIPLSFCHGEALEFIWTVLPAVILCLIALPSISLLYVLDEILHSDLSIKIIGNQWYWVYEYGDYIDTKVVESFMVNDPDLEFGQLRLLTTDNALVLPVFTSIRLLVTSNDVIHSFAVPSLGLKLDAIPGR